MGIVFLSMIFLHLLYDFTMQGWLAEAKQKNWWLKQDGYKPLYKYDYLVALLVHSFLWTGFMMLPAIIAMYFAGIGFGSVFYLVFVLNVLIHALMDNSKANLGHINLVVDQLLHLGQVFATFVALFGVFA